MLERHICCEVWGLAVAVPPLLVFHREDVEALRKDGSLLLLSCPYSNNFQGECFWVQRRERIFYLKQRHISPLQPILESYRD